MCVYVCKCVCVRVSVCVCMTTIQVHPSQRVSVCVCVYLCVMERFHIAGISSCIMHSSRNGTGLVQAGLTCTRKA